MVVKRRTSSKNPPILSHEFVIQNHADIISCVAMVFVIGLLFQATAPIASYFVAMHHNVTEATSPTDIVYFTYGTKDLCVVFFYFLIAIVMHAIVQEYVLDKLNRKMHLSKLKHSKFNESGQLLLFYLVSLVWGGDIILKEGYMFDMSRLWVDYPHTHMTFMFKFYFIIQISYWLHCYPELYFQKVKKEEMKDRITYASLYLVFFSSAYVFNFTRVAVCLSVLHYIGETVFHIARLLYFAEKSKAARYGFMTWNVCFIILRICSVLLTVLMFWYGLPGISTSNIIDIRNGNFNTPVIRINCLLGMCLLQAWMVLNFVNFHLKRIRERAASTAINKKKAQGKKEKKQRKEEAKKTSEDEVNELPEVDQNTKKDLKSRNVVVSPSSKLKHN